MTISARKIGFRAGVPTTTSCPFVVCSLTGEDIVVSISPPDDTAKTIAASGGDAVLSVIGTDAGYVGNSSFTGLSPFTQYTWTATQGSNTETGTFYTAPEAGDDFSLAFGSCWRCDSTYGGAGAWSHIRAKAAGSLPCVGVFFVDDYGYVDQMQVTGLSSGPPSSTALEKDYAIAWLCVYGLYDAALGQYATGSLEDDYQWCAFNLNLFPQFGDHEFKQDCGWDDAVTSPAFSSNFSAGKACWDAFMAPLQGDTTGFTDAANHWYADLGDVRLLSLDGITNCDGCGGSPSYVNGAETSIANQFGNEQVDDILIAANSPHAFKLLGMPRGIRYVDDDNSLERNRGNQMTVYNHSPTEYARLFTRSNAAGAPTEPPSLMDLDATNGVDGTLVVLHGDYHNAHVYLHEAPSGVNIHRESFYEIGAGTINGSTNAATPDGLVTGSVSDDGNASIEYFPDNVSGGSLHWWSVLIDVFGSHVNKQMSITVTDESGVVQWGKKFMQRRLLNYAIPLDSEPFNITSPSEPVGE